MIPEPYIPHLEHQIAVFCNDNGISFQHGPPHRVDQFGHAYITLSQGIQLEEGCGPPVAWGEDCIEMYQQFFIQLKNWLHGRKCIVWRHFPSVVQDRAIVEQGHNPQVRSIKRTLSIYCRLTAYFELPDAEANQ